MNKSILRRLRITATVAVVAAILALRSTEALPSWLAFVLVGIVALTQVVWELVLGDATDFAGPLTRPERTFQLAVIGVYALLLVACLSGVGITGIAATVGSCVAAMSLGGAVRGSDVKAAAVAAAGLCLLALTTGMTSASVILSLVSWSGSVATFVTLRAAARHPLRSGTAPCMRLAWIGAPLTVSVVTAFLALLLIPLEGSGGIGPGNALGGLTGQSGARRTGSYDGAMDLNARGNMPTHPVAEVPADSPAYWRSGTLSHYDGRLFSAGARPVNASAQRNESGLLVGPLMRNGTKTPSNQPTVTYTVNPFDDVVLAPGHLQSVSLAPDQVKLRSGSVLVLSSPGPYQVTSTLPHRARDVGGVSLLTVGGSGNSDLEVPLTVPARTRQLATQITQGATTRAEAVAMIEDYLRTNFRYDLGAPQAPRGRDAVDFFLFDSRSGFCEHFAAAEVILLRAVGVPARVAVGYSGGKPTPGDASKRLITADRGHAWVEVDMGAAGWLLSDATPSSESTGRWSVTSVVDLINRATSNGRHRVIAALLLLFVVLVGWVLVRRLSRPRPAPRELSSTGRSELEASLDRLMVALDRSGQGSVPSETLAELGIRLNDASGPLLVAERAIYSAERVGSVEQSQAAGRIDAVTAGLLTEAKREDERRRAAQGWRERLRRWFE